MNPTHLRLRDWFTDDPADPGRMLLNDPDVQQLVTAISPESQATDLGGVMSLNVRLDVAGLVLRLHQPFVSRQRLLAVQEMRRQLHQQGLLVPTPRQWRNKTVFRCRNRWAELDTYLPHERLAPTFDSYAWMFRAMGTLHVALKRIALPIPRPLVATYAPPSSLQRWLSVTEAAVKGNPQAEEAACHLRELVQHLRKLWMPASKLPVQFVHGDVRLSNVCRAVGGETIYFDFGFLARRPRIHDLAYALAFMIPALGSLQSLDSFAWQQIPELIEEYEAAAKTRLTSTEIKALLLYTVSVPLYAAALDGFTESPAKKLCSRLPFLKLSRWLLAHPTALRG